LASLVIEHSKRIDHTRVTKGEQWIRANMSDKHFHCYPHATLCWQRNSALNAHRQFEHSPADSSATDTSLALG